MRHQIPDAWNTAWLSAAIVGRAQNETDKDNKTGPCAHQIPTSLLGCRDAHLKLVLQFPLS
jgi:hypothetical protein